MKMGVQHRVVIVGGGFGGICAAQALKRAPVQVTLIDRRNFHLFQPLLYQVATGGLSPANISAPLRVVLKRQSNTSVRLGEVVDVDVANQQVVCGDGEKIGYDTLIVAAGSVSNYFGNEQWQEDAPGLKSMADADEIRRRVLLAFESAETEPDAQKRQAWLTFVIAGGGTSGVELAGALSELAHHTLKRDFRQIDPRSARILLVEGGDRLLPTFPVSLSAKANATLARMGVEIQTSARVTDVQADSITITKGDQTQHVATRTVLWAAGVQASPLGRLIAQRIGSEVDNGGRIPVGSDLTISGHPELLILGDLARVIGEDGKPLPGVAQVAIQQGHYAAKLIRRRIAGKDLPAFRYKDYGSLAVIGRNAAVADLNWLRVGGFFAWLLWLFVHLRATIQFQNRILVLMQWMWSYITRNQSALLIPDKNPNWRLGDVGRTFTPK